MKTPRFALLTLAALVVHAASAHAQSQQGGVASVAVGAAAIESNTEVAISGSFAYRLNRVVGLGVEVTTIPGLKGDRLSDRDPSLLSDSGALTALGILSPIAIDPDGGRAIFFTTNVRLEVPVASSRVIPFVIAGGGVATIREEFTEQFRFVDFPSTLIPGVVLPVIPPQTLKLASTNLALTLGGGVSFALTPHLTVDADLRYFYLTGSRDMNVGRFGGGLSYRF